MTQRTKFEDLKCICVSRCVKACLTLVLLVDNWRPAGLARHQLPVPAKPELAIEFYARIVRT
jgi:hypothetical protein